jgi:putative transposase
LLAAVVDELDPLVGVRAACKLSGVSRASHYRAARGPLHGPPTPRPSPPNKLSDAEVDALLELMNSPRFVDLAPAQIWAILLDEGTYAASISTMYRVLRTQHQVHERRAQATHPPRARPELTALAANQVWSWDITKLRGPARGVWYDCYVIIDIFSRYVVAWMVATTETAELAKTFIAAAVSGQGVPADQLAIHADRGTSMTSKPVAALLADLGVARSHSRPHVSNDNPYSEAVNKTLKYCPAFPDRFGSIEDARAFCAQFFD